jgi:hypothetical protein
LNAFFLEQDMLETPFWRHAASSLPAHVRERYAAQLEAAERLDIALDAAIDMFRRVSGADARKR